MNPRRMVLEPCAGEVVIPSPFVFCIGCGVDTNVSATCLDVSFEISFLVVVQEIACSIQEDNCSVLLQ